MNFVPNSVFDKTNLILDLLTKRQEAVSSNIANVNTPGYVRQDINFGEYLNTLGCPLETKLSQKLGPSPIMYQKGGEVIMSQEMLAMQKNLLYYTIATRKINSTIQEIKSIAQLGR
jgi:flagellar basal-body rod protein FlgB